ncbi:hypothetical protein [Curtobacterium oceanosedimentum]|uniref:hypothetical protein n=1 Tax=Curtobacterium oceanosedimentum TaxID=465820 RepID=UPI001CE0809B|nr:hypothetical protein [Curtobacterium oceanosedimentum]MCA5924919.1 hypothetical protein [Curtobacterium oceanosedimentum]
MRRSRTQGLVWIAGGCLFVVVFGLLFFLYPRSQATLIPQILVPVGVVEIVVGVALLVRSRR